jgi:hypothetical protein
MAGPARPRTVIFGVVLLGMVLVGLAGILAEMTARETLQNEGRRRAAAVGNLQSSIMSVGQETETRSSAIWAAKARMEAAPDPELVPEVFLARAVRAALTSSVELVRVSLEARMLVIEGSAASEAAAVEYAKGISSEVGWPVELPRVEEGEPGSRYRFVVRAGTSLAGGKP